MTADQTTHQQEVTGWLDGSQKPVRPGVYERKFEAMRLHDFAKWDGRRWMIGYGTPEEADNLVMHESLYQPWFDNGFQWRGLTKEQK